MSLTTSDRAVLRAWRDLLDAHQIQEAAPERSPLTQAAVHGLVLRAEDAFKAALVDLGRASQPEPRITALDSEAELLADVHRRIAALPPPQQREAMKRASRSYSAPDHCVRFDGCRREGDEVVWPDGERWPTRPAAAGKDP